jgi:hypothetical protein
LSNGICTVENAVHMYNTTIRFPTGTALTCLFACAGATTAALAASAPAVPTATRAALWQIIFSVEWDLYR